MASRFFFLFIFQSPDEKIEELVRSKSNKFRSFIPDFSLRVSEDVQILRISRVQWLAAVRATYFEKKQTASGAAPMLNSDGEEIDLLQQELEKVGQVDSTTINSDPIRERTSSLALTIGSDTGNEQEKSLLQHQPMKTISNANRFASDSPMNSGGTTPTTAAEKRRRNLFRSATTTAAPPSLTDESPSSKNPSST